MLQIRVSSEISNAPFILNLDCDMYSNNPDTIKESLCFFLDRKKSHDIAFVQFPQDYNNVTKNKIYGIPDKVINEVRIRKKCHYFLTKKVNEQDDAIIHIVLLQIDLVALDGYGAALYCGTGCFHRRETLCGKKYSKDVSGSVHLDVQTKKEVAKTVYELEEACKLLVDCNFENGSQWGKEVSLSLSLPNEIDIRLKF